MYSNQTHQSWRSVESQFGHTRILNGQTEAGQSSDVLPLGLGHEDVLQPSDLRLVLVGQSLRAFATVEEVSGLDGWDGHCEY